MKIINKVLLIGFFNAGLAFNVSAGEALPLEQGNHVKVENNVELEGIAARRAYIDPQTGKLKNTPPSQNNISTGNAQSRTSSIIKDDPPLEIIEHKNGMKQINLNGRFMSSNTVSVKCTVPEGVDIEKLTVSEIKDVVNCKNNGAH